MPAPVRTRWNREAPLAWVAAVQRGAPVTAGQHNAMVATIAAVRDALAQPSRPRASPDDANPTVGLTALRPDATPADLATWDALGRMLMALRSPPSTRGHYATDDGPTSAVTVGGIAADALVPDTAAMYVEATVACETVPALVRDALALILTTQHAEAIATEPPAPPPSPVARAAAKVADLAERAKQWINTSRKGPRAAGSGSVGVAASATVRRKRKASNGNAEQR